MVELKFINFSTNNHTAGALVNGFVALNGFWLWWYDSGIVATIGVVWMVFNLTPVILHLLDSLASETQELFTNE